jgi:hypothetical protein
VSRAESSPTQLSWRAPAGCAMKSKEEVLSFSGDVETASEGKP